MPFPLAAVAILKPAMGLLKGNWKVIILVSMVAMLLYQNFSDKRFMFFLETIPSLEKRLDVAENNFKIAQEGNRKLVATIEKRNDEIKQWKTTSEVLEKENSELKGTILKHQDETEIEIEVILEGTTPQTCGEAMEYLREYRKEIKW